MMFKEYNLFGSTYVTTQESEVIDMLHFKGFSAHFVYDNTTPAAGEFTANVTDICTKAAHGFVTGLKVRVSTTTTLPGGLLGATDYFVIVGGENTFSLSDTLAHALAGTNIVNITDAGTGTHTITPTALAGSLAKIQGSNDGVTFTDLASQTGNITADGSALYNQYGVFYRYIKCYFTATAGQVLLTCKVVLKGE
jgi:hypothetical protein